MRSRQTTRIDSSRSHGGQNKKNPGFLDWGGHYWLSLQDATLLNSVMQWLCIDWTITREWSFCEMVWGGGRDISHGVRHQNLNLGSATSVTLGKSLYWPHLSLTSWPILQEKYVLGGKLNEIISGKCQYTWFKHCKLLRSDHFLLLC